MMFGAQTYICDKCGTVYWIKSLHEPYCKGIGSAAARQRLAPFFDGLRDHLNRPTA
jgi:uncharacterized protein with PIN domain